MVCLHILAVFYHQLHLKEKVLQAMVFGTAAGREGREVPIPWWSAIMIVVMLGLALWWGLEQAPGPTFMAW